MRECSIIIVTYNGWELVRECLGALEVEVRPGVDVTVIDNGSVDDVPARVRVHFPWVRVVEARTNLGFAAGNNLGLGRTDGEYVVLLNSDVIVQRGFIDALLDPLESSSRIGSVAASMVFHSNPGVVASAGIEVFTNGLALDRSLGAPLRELSANQSVFGVSAGAAAYRRAALTDVGGFPESFFMYLEDVDLAWRLRLRGWESVHAARAVAEHAYSGTAGEGSAFKRKLLARNRIWYIVRCTPSWLLARTWWRILAYDLTVGLSAAARRDGASLSGRVEALLNLKPRLAERKTIQQNVTAIRSEVEPWIQPPPPLSQLLRLRELTRIYGSTKP